MTFGYGIGIANLIPEEFDEFYPDEILDYLIDYLYEVSEELEFPNEAVVREILWEPGVDLYAEDYPTERPTVIGASWGSGGVLPDREAQPILNAIKDVETAASVPNVYSYSMPDRFANILIPGFGAPLLSSIKLDDFCVTPLQKFYVGGLEPHLAASTQWRDSICNNPGFVPVEASREEIIEFYDESLLPMLHLCNEHRLIFVME